MKQKTSVTLSEDVIAGLEKAKRQGESRSQTVDRLSRPGGTDPKTFRRERHSL